MNFAKKVEKIITLLKTSTLEELIRDFEIENIDELEKLYNQDRKKFMETFFCNVMSIETYFNPLLTNDREFLEEYTPSVRDYINFRILQSNETINSSDEYPNKSEITIDDFLTISNLLNFPPLPLTRYYFDEEHHRDKSQIILKLFNESSYKCLESCKELFKLVINGEISGNFKIIFDGGYYNVHNFIVKKYELFNIIRSDEITLNTNNKNIVEVIIEFLYTGSFDYKLFSKQNFTELLELADYLQIVSLIQILELLLDDTDLEQKRNIENSVKSVKKWIQRIIDEFEENDTEVIKLLILEDMQNLIAATEQDDFDGIYSCVEHIGIKLYEFVKNSNNDKYKHNLLQYYIPKTKLGLINKIFGYSYKLPIKIKKYVKLLNEINDEDANSDEDSDL